MAYYVDSSGHCIRGRNIRARGEASGYAVGLPTSTLPSGASLPTDISSFTGSSFGSATLVDQRTIATNVASFSVTPAGPDAVTLALVVTASILHTNDYSLSLSDTIKLRN